jgi:zinc and cadmium transporter
VCEVQVADPVLWWILGSGLLMSAIALVGSVTLLLDERTLKRVQGPLVALAAGSLIGGALFHLLPAAMTGGLSPEATGSMVAAGFLAFFLLEQLLHHHHGRHGATERKEPFSYLILVGDGLHNFLGGLAIASTFLVDIRLGVTAWLAAAAHEVPQELGDFAVLVRGGWRRRRALVYNLLSALTFPLGGVVTYLFAQAVDTSWLVPFAAGNFLYIGAADLIPEVTRHLREREEPGHAVWFVLGLAVLWVSMLLRP